MVEKKITKRTLQALESRKKIHNAAIELMNKKGFANTTIEEICKNANVSIGAFYHYYKSKDDIYIELFHEGDEYFNQKVKPLLKKLSPPEQIVVFFKEYAKFTVGRGLDAIKHFYNTNNHHFTDKNRYMHILLKNIIEQHKKQNKFENITCNEFENYLFILARGIVFDWCLNEGSYDLVESMENKIKLTVNSIN